MVPLHPVVLYFLYSRTKSRAVISSPRSKGSKETRMVMDTAIAAAESAFSGVTMSDKKAMAAATKTATLRMVSAHTCCSKDGGSNSGAR